MKKLTMHFTAILIGLSLLSCDPEESFYIDFYQRVFENTTNVDVSIVYHSLDSTGEKLDTLRLKANSKMAANFTSSVSSDGVKDGNSKLIIERNVGIYYDHINDYGKFELFVGNELKKEWIGPPEYLGGGINNPYNYDSWSIIKYDKPIRDGDNFIYGEIVFTVSNEDIGD
ncbi:hypothetical protein [Flagellimonas ruestringensis]|nr:hypothetical protein [Allomuricauda ruestringensis]